ncbi:hypothetical protein B0I35DRAFT_483640 [Stachybotrys elegans]|uniref:Expansin-like EG45 domain-containing protein n=1 Tax=Stachybotrys elegans TaxID=80388 RepID=A0A8K0WLR1_9HYPO|nr:hypothetical protein B0I35DRAFT_483640 [Stachybotrys elegans]
MEHNNTDTGKEVRMPEPFIEQSTFNVSQAVQRNSSDAPQFVDYGGLEVVNHNDTNKEFMTAKPLPIPPKYDDYHPIPMGVVDPSAPPPKPKWKPSKKLVIIVVAVSIVAIVAIVAGAVVGTRNSGSGSGSSGESDESNRGDASATTTSAPAPSSSAVTIPTEDEVRIGSTFTASFTYYGSGDSGDGDSCKNYGNACGIMTDPGYAVQVSEWLYAEGLTCGTCWRLEPHSSDEGQRMNSRIVVMINEMCPALGYPICGQRDSTATNMYGAQVNFNLCVDTGAWDAFAGRNSGIGLAMGNVTRVSCDEWEGRNSTRFD